MKRSEENKRSHICRYSSGVNCEQNLVEKIKLTKINRLKFVITNQLINY